MAGSRRTTPLAKATTHNRAVWKQEDLEFAPDPAEDFEQPATAKIVDFAAAWKYPEPENKTPRVIQKFIDERPESPDQLLLTQKRIRARARRAARHGKEISKEERDIVWKPVEDWDFEELARGRPRAADGTFRGRTPKFVTRAIHEQAMEQFKRTVRLELNGKTVDALQVMSQILANDDYDEKGRPVVPAGTRLDAAKFLIEHVVGKAVQPTTSDISVKLQGILGMAMVNPTEDGGYAPAHMGTRGELTTGLSAEDDLENQPFDNDVDEDVQDAEVVWGDDDEL